MKGFLQTNQGLMLMVARPIYDSQSHGPSHGALVMGRFFSSSVKLSIAKNVSVPFDFLTESDASLNAAERNLFNHLADATEDSKLEFDHGFLYQTVSDITGRPAFLLRVPTRNEITTLGRRTGWILSITLGLIALGLLICLVVYRFRMKASEEQLRTLNDELEQRVERRTRELQETQSQYLHAEKLSAIGKFSASIAHEFNNPLQSVINILKGLNKRAILAEEDKEMLDLAIGESERMKNLIRNLQDFNRPSSGEKVLMDLHTSINSLLLLCRSDFKRKKLSTELNYAERLPQILAIADQIKQVLINLLANAADACLAGGVITISTWQEDKRVAVAIKDNGIGIEPERMDLIFQPFYTTKPAIKGTGLGLSICHGIVENHQGEIRVESRPGEGSTFTVLLPITGE